MIGLFLIAAGLLLASTPANAFWQSRDSNYGKTVTAGPVYTGPGDILSGAVAFWSCQRAYNAAYATGSNKGCNIRRASDNETCDFLIATSGSIGGSTSCSGADNGISLATFLTSTTGYVTKAYDQSGHGYDVAQAAGAAQPQLTLAAIGGLPAMTGYNTGQYIAATLAALSNPVYMTGVANRTGGTTNQSAILSTYASGTNLFFGYGSAVNTATLYGGAYLNAAAADNAAHAFGYLANSTTSVISIDGTETAGDSGAGGTGTTFTLLGQGSGPTNPLTGYVGEAGVWNTAPASGVRTSLCHNMRLYWGTGGSC